MRDGALIYRSAFTEGLKPDPDLTVSQWADRYRMLSNKASAEPGPWRTERTPYLKEIMDCMSANSAVQKVVFMAGAQLGQDGGHQQRGGVHDCPRSWPSTYLCSPRLRWLKGSVSSA
jgi:hypothetical protein